MLIRMRQSNLKKQNILIQAALISTVLMVPLAYADIIVNGNNSSTTGLFVPPLLTSIVGDIEVTPTGQIAAAGVDAVIVDSAVQRIILDANNIHGGPPGVALSATGAGIGINILNTGPAATVIVGTGTAIDTSVGADGIKIAANSANINNSGSILSGSSAIEVDGGGTNANITNQVSGILKGLTNTQQTIFISDIGSTIINSGTIFSTPALSALLYNTSFDQLINTATGVIDNIGTGGSGVNLNTAVTGIVLNRGVIRINTSTGAALTTGALFTGSITNNSGALIQTNGTGTAVLISSPISNLVNAGTIEATANGGSALIIAAGATSGNINNSGSILSQDTTTVEIGDSITKLTNSGTIESATAAKTIATIAAGITLSDGIVNSGYITNNTIGGTAIDLQSSGLLIFIPLTQNAGTIKGNVFLASGGGTVLTMNGGTIDGDVIAASSAANTLQLNGGTITGTTFLGNAGDTVNLVSTDLQALLGGTGNDVINIMPPGNSPFVNEHPSFTSLNGNGGADILNVNDSFTANGTITNIQTINVNNVGTAFIANKAITNVSTLIDIKPGASMTANANVSGAGVLQNDGTFTIGNNVIVNMSSNTINNGILRIDGGGRLLTNGYFQNPGAQFAVQLQSPTIFGQIQPGAVGAALSGTVRPFLGPGPFIPAETVFPVINSIGPINDNTTLVQPNSPIVFFTKSVDACGFNSCLDLTLHLHSFESGATTNVAEQVAASLDSILAQFPNINPDFLALFGQLERLTPEAFNSALESLAPSFNYAIVQGSHFAMDNVFDSLQVRLEDLRRVKPKVVSPPSPPPPPPILIPPIIRSGFNYGDFHDIYNGRGYNAVWARVFATDLRQNERDDAPGFNIDASGLSIGGDWEITPCSAIGIAGSYITQDTTNDSFIVNTIDTKSYQATLYGWLEPADNVYIDGMIGFAYYNYDTTRNIAVGNIFATPTASFYGLQYGAQMDVGYVYAPSESLYIVPLARFKYTYLDIKPYTENGADDLDLEVTNDDLDEVIAGVGVRVGSKYSYRFGVYVPEISALIMYDFAGSPQEMTAEFLGGGIPFFIDSVSPAQTIYLLGLGVNAHVSHNTTYSVKYNLELRDGLTSNTGYFKFHYAWD